MSELGEFCSKNEDHPILGEEVGGLSSAAKRLKEVALELSSLSESDPLQWASNTYPALLCFGDVTISWRLLDMAIVAQRAMDNGKENDFYRGKVIQAKYFCGVTLPLTLACLDTCLRKGREIVEIPKEAF
jgi:hypothetical protein